MERRTLVHRDLQDLPEKMGHLAKMGSLDLLDLLVCVDRQGLAITAHRLDWRLVTNQ